MGRAPASDDGNDEGLPLPVGQRLILSPPEGVGEIPTIDPFGDTDRAVVPFPGPSLFERVAMAARTRSWHPGTTEMPRVA
jgi:hypothetical protein